MLVSSFLRNLIISLSESEKLEYVNFPAFSIQMHTDIYKNGCAKWPNKQHHLGKLFTPVLCAPSHFWLEISPFAVRVFLLYLPECWAVPEAEPPRISGCTGGDAQSWAPSAACLSSDSAAHPVLLSWSFSRYFKGHPSAICWSSYDKWGEEPL